MANCEVCKRSSINAFFHQALHKENDSNKVVQVVLALFILMGVTFAILGLIPNIPFIATVWGIGIITVSLIAFGVFKHYSSPEEMRSYYISVARPSVPVVPEQSWRQEEVWQQLEAGSVAIAKGRVELDAHQYEGEREKIRFIRELRASNAHLQEKLGLTDETVRDWYKKQNLTYPDASHIQ